VQPIFPSNGGVLAPARGWFLPIKYIHFFLLYIVSKHGFFPPATVAVKEKHNALCLILFAPSRRGGCKIRTFSVTNFHLNFKYSLFSKHRFFPPAAAGRGKKKTKQKKQKRKIKREKNKALHLILFPIVHLINLIISQINS